MTPQKLVAKWANIKLSNTTQEIFPLIMVIQTLPTKLTTQNIHHEFILDIIINMKRIIIISSFLTFFAFKLYAQGKTYGRKITNVNLLDTSFSNWLPKINEIDSLTHHVLILKNEFESALFGFGGYYMPYEIKFSLDTKTTKEEAITEKLNHLTIRQQNKYDFYKQEMSKYIEVINQNSQLILLMTKIINPNNHIGTPMYTYYNTALPMDNNTAYISRKNLYLVVYHEIILGKAKEFPRRFKKLSYIDTSYFYKIKPVVKHEKIEGVYEFNTIEVDE